MGIRGEEGDRAGLASLCGGLGHSAAKVRLVFTVDTPVAPLRVVVVGDGHTRSASQGGCW